MVRLFALDGQNLDMGRGLMLYIVISIMGADSVGSTVGFSGCPFEDVPLVEFMYLVFTRMLGENYRRRLRSLLLYLCYVFRALINSLAC